MKNQLDVIVIVGPTASGKTDTAVGLAHCLAGEIVNGDAMQVYRGLDIGTAKITADEMEGIPHHLFDIKAPEEPFSAAEYQQIVREKITEIKQRGKMPIVVGGTGLYIQSVLYDYRFTEAAGDERVRARLEEELAETGQEPLYRRLTELDPESARKIHPNNHRRLIRALEILEVSGNTKAEQESDVGAVPVMNALIAGLDMPREILYERIDRRVERMMDAGLLEEVGELRRQGIRDVQSVQAIGYKELYEALDCGQPLDEAVDLVKRNTRRYAKRQMTYFRNKLPVCWLDAQAGRDELVRIICSKVKECSESMANREGSFEEKQR
ncbi:tRNA (adenosine(37)-N6)-dimethylallyltransferase MiaA [Sporosarcina trichiuri]|uniref:tRNA (adenosine(37)-N6)-dimethylallyltransferase MiaA n=1 Tax=Sporosarcina trichiuri TaxID=3056445 RepID=UPI0025B3AAAC|nr:tRNA (adenosine(37)-N6)-dimethylallyltransferase MiaA [Sporosarcina sp. 0.2-SM1T-5]WJY28661.1 tRNA (adenosine(37)-N6)-dimethylallyltransferase MiaA [Sporosarcina sp. 0.2-SM1T-5]